MARGDHGGARKMNRRHGHLMRFASVDNPKALV